MVCGQRCYRIFAHVERFERLMNHIFGALVVNGIPVYNAARHMLVGSFFACVTVAFENIADGSVAVNRNRFDGDKERRPKPARKKIFAVKVVAMRVSNQNVFDFSEVYSPRHRPIIGVGRKIYEQIVVYQYLAAGSVNSSLARLIAKRAVAEHCGYSFGCAAP